MTDSTQTDDSITYVDTTNPTIARAEAAEAEVEQLRRNLASATAAGAAVGRHLEREMAAVARVKAAAAHPFKGPDDTDASMLREASKRLRGGYELGGSNTKQTVANVLDAVAAAIEGTGR